MRFRHDQTSHQKSFPASSHHMVRLRSQALAARLEHTLLSWHRCLRSMGVRIELRNLRYLRRGCRGGKYDGGSTATNWARIGWAETKYQPKLRFQPRDTEDGMPVRQSRGEPGMFGAHDEHVSRFSYGRVPALSANNVLRSYSAHRTPERTSIAPFRIELQHLVI
jgi:hypothetical protein